MALHPRMQALRRKHNYRLGLLFGDFIQRHPDVDPELDNWTAEQEQAWREFTTDFSARCQAERHALAVELGLLPRNDTPA
jgi:hypothetical protein